MRQGPSWILVYRDDAPARRWWAHLAWVVAGAAAGFAVPAVFSAALALPRNVYLVAYIGLVGAFLAAYARWAGVDVAASTRSRWVWGVAVGIAAALFSVRTVLMQDASPAPEGPRLLGSLVWLGLVYGAMDAVFLTVFPLGAVWRAMSQRGVTAHWSGRLAAATLALVASLGLIAAYHLGYAEFRGPEVGVVVLGVGIQSLLTLVAGSPIAIVVSHVAMHVAAVLYGMDSVIQLPPHY